MMIDLLTTTSSLLVLFFRGFCVGRGKIVDKRVYDTFQPVKEKDLLLSVIWEITIFKS